MTTRAAVEKTSKYWEQAIGELSRKREEHNARAEQLTERRRALSLDAHLDASGPARKEIDRLGRELADLSAAREELSFAIEEAQQHLTAARATESAAAEEERQTRCRAIARRAVEVAREFDASCQAANTAADRFKAVLDELRSEDPRVGSSFLYLRGAYTRSMRAAGLQDHADLAPTLGASTEPLAVVTASCFENWLKKE